jgi:hypothetical protein
MRAMADEIESYIAQLHAAGVSAVVLGWQQEWDITAEAGYAPVRRAWLVAYRAGEMLKLDVPGEDVDRQALAGRLRAAGLVVTLRSRNRA